jgi:anti-sigma factor RsiW
VNCQSFEDRLDDFLDGALSPEEKRAAAAHLASCVACSELLQIVRGNLDLGAGVQAGDDDRSSAAGDAGDLVDSVVARTCGPACGRAQSLLCDFVDGSLEETSTHLVSLHAERCVRCRALAETLRWLAPVLTTMALGEPAEDFATEVLAATAGTRKRPRERLEGLRQWWLGLMARPRIAWELAYVGTLVLVVLCGTSVSPFRNVPPRALAMIQVDPSQTYQSASERLAGTRSQISGAGSRGWHTLSDPVAGRIDAAKRGFATAHPELAGSFSDLGEHSDQLGQALVHGNLLQSSILLDQVGRDLQRIWKAF